jgi:Holliday junction resolvasome RuvABC endonuclease subunit
MKVIGIDYSMTAPSITIIDGDKTVSHYLTSIKRHQTTYDLGSFVIRGHTYPPHNSQEDRFDQISHWAICLCDISPDCVIIEDYAMGAKGKVFHIAENTGLLKHKLWKRKIDFKTIAPTSLKKFATGKGNADKCLMHVAFESKTGLNLMKIMDIESKDCGSPVSDVVDSYFLAMFAKNAIEITR